MAKGKHARALFEVVNQNKTGSQPAKPAARPQPVLFNRDTNPPAAPRSKPVEPAKPKVNIDPERQQIAFHLSYTNAAIVAFGLIVVIGLAIYVGRNGSSRPAVVIAPSTVEQVRAQAPQPDVLNITPETHNGLTAMATEGGVRQSTGTQTPPVVTAQMTGLPRQINANYVIVQTYPDETSANAARDILVQNGIECTVEKGPPGWARMDWFSVVGTRGFLRIRCPEYETYVKSITAISGKFAGKSKFKQFDPRAYKWKE